MNPLQSIYDFINYYENELIDPRSKNYFIVYYPSVTISMIAAYLLLIKYILPSYMKSRPAYRLTSVLFYYNIFQVIVNVYIVYLAVRSYGTKYSLFKCRELYYSTTDPYAVMGFHAIYYYMLLKFTEFFDTFFFILRKKDNQVSFLHVYHHATMVLNSWLAFRYMAGGTTVFPAGLNASIHVVMYTYYLLSSLGPQWQKYLWWKKYLTSFQIIQFIFGIVVSIFQFASPENCPEFMRRHVLLTYAILYTISLLYLFSRFYTNTYTKPSKQLQNGICQNNNNKIE